MSKEAIQKDVSGSEVFNPDRMAALNAISEARSADRGEDADARSEDAGTDERLNRMNELSQEREQDRDSEDGEDALAAMRQQAERLNDELQTMAEDGAPVTDEADAPEVEAAEPEVEADDDADDDAPESPVFFENGQWMTRIKVDGEVKAVPFQKIHAAAQKLDAGDKRLEEANRMLRDIEAREQRLLDLNRQPTNQPPAQGADGPGQTETGQLPEDILALGRQYQDALLNGDDEDAAVELLAKLATAGARAPNVDVDQLAQQIEARVTAQFQAQEQQRAQAQYQKSLSEAFDTFKTEFEDVAADPMLLDAADRYTVTIAQENPTLTPLQVMREAGKRTRLWLAEKTGTQPRVSRKRNLKTAVGNGARQSPAPTETPKSRQDVLNEMRQKRGQTPLG